MPRLYHKATVHFVTYKPKYVRHMIFGHAWDPSGEYLKGTKWCQDTTSCTVLFWPYFFLNFETVHLK